MARSQKLIISVAVILAIITAVIITYSSSIFIQLFIALALAYILNPLVGRLQKSGLKRIYAIGVVFTVASLAFAGFLFFVVVSISGELSSVQINLPAYVKQIYTLIPPYFKKTLAIETPELFYLKLDGLTSQIQSVSPDLWQPVVNIVRKILSSTVSLLLSAVGYLIIPVYLFYLLLDLQIIKSTVESFVPRSYLPVYSRIISDIDTILTGFVKGQLSVCAILAVLYSGGLYFIGIDLSITIGLLAGGTFIIPYVGTIIGIILASLMALLKFNDLLHPLLCVGWFGLVQLLEGALITPKIVGDTVGLHPLTAIVALLIGGQLFGILGMLLAVPVAAILQVLLRHYVEYYRTSDFYQGK